MSLKCCHENSVWHEIVTQGHSGSFILQSITSGQVIAYRNYNNAEIISKVSEENLAVKIAENCRRRQPHCRLTSPPRGTPANIRIIIAYISRNWSHWPTFLPLILCDYLHSYLVVGSKRRILAALACISAVQRHPRSMILVPMVLSCTVSEIRRLTGWKLRILPTPLSFVALAPYVRKALY